MPDPMTHLHPLALAAQAGSTEASRPSTSRSSTSLGGAAGTPVGRVVVLGAAGQTGRLVVEELLRTGRDVTAAVRNPDTFVPVAQEASSHHSTLTVVRADVRDESSMFATVQGHDAVVSAVGPSGRHARGLYSEGARSLVGAMARAGVRRVIAISSAGVRHDDPHFSWWYRILARTLLRELYDDMRLMERLFRESTLDWTFIRPTRLLNEAPTGAYRVEDGETPRGGRQMPRADLARFIVQALDDPRWSRAAPTLAR